MAIEKKVTTYGAAAHHGAEAASPPVHSEMANERCRLAALPATILWPC